MKNICLILPSKLPVPNINGGAIETLLTLLIDENEIQKKVRFTIVCSWANGIEDATRKYKYTDFYFFKQRNGVIKKAISLFNYIIAKTTGNIDILKTPMHFDIERIIKNIKPDAVVVEHGIYKNFGFLKKYFNKEQLYLHLHGTGPLLKESIYNVFGNLITVSSFLDGYYCGSSRHFHNHYVCLNGINDKVFRQRITIEEKMLLRKKLNLTAEDYVFLYCGRLVPEKGVLELVKAICATQQNTVKLLIVGSSNFAHASKTKFVEKLESEVEHNPGRVVFTGYIPNDRLYKYYQIADCQVVCSKCDEAAGLVAVEGTMSGIPLIINDVGGLKEYFDLSNTLVINKHIYKNYDSISHYLVDELKTKIEELASANMHFGASITHIDDRFTSESFYKRFIDLFD